MLSNLQMLYHFFMKNEVILKVTQVFL